MAFKFHRRSRLNYWSHSKLVEWLDRNNVRQTSRKKSYTVEELKARLRMSKGFFENVANKLQNICMFPSDLYHSIRIYFKNSKGNTHVLDGGLEKGQWYDLTYRIPHCLFFELDKFITQEKGLETHEWEKALTYNEDYGIGPDHELYGKLTDQAVSAIEQDKIWNWWKENKDNAEFGDVEYQKQEEEMLIRLIKIRGSLWS